MASEAKDGNYDRILSLSNVTAAYAELECDLTPLKIVDADSGVVELVSVEGLVESFAKPGSRLTGVHYQQSADIVSKRLDVTKGLLPGLRKVVTFYDPGNVSAAAAIKTAREAARQLGIELVERPVASVEELRRSVEAPGPEIGAIRRNVGTTNEYHRSFELRPFETKVRVVGVLRMQRFVLIPACKFRQVAAIA